VALSLFPELKPDQPFGPIPESVQVGTNADLIAALADLYLSDGSVLDVTYGRGKWWDRFRPDDFRGHDLATDGVDFTQLPYADGSWDVVVYDPPYVPTGSPTTNAAALAGHRDRYGIAGYRNMPDLDALIRAGLSEACRVARRWVLVKCADYTAGQNLVLGHVKVLGWVTELGWVCQDLVVHWSGTGPGGHNIWTPRRTRRAHSYLLVLKPGKAVMEGREVA
jgi:hypothetical protein